MAETITIGCKLPSGLILRVVDKSGHEQRHEIRGSKESKIIGGYGITHDVPKEFWDRWVALHPEFPALKSGVIFAVGKAADADREARNGETVKSGFEGVDPSDLKGGKVTALAA